MCGGGGRFPLNCPLLTWLYLPPAERDKRRTDWLAPATPKWKTCQPPALVSNTAYTKVNKSTWCQKLQRWLTAQAFISSIMTLHWLGAGFSSKTEIQIISIYGLQLNSSHYCTYWKLDIIWVVLIKNRFKKISCLKTCQQTFRQWLAMVACC